MATATQTQNRYAICIGINTYAPQAVLGALQYAEADAQAMDTFLGQRGFPDHHRRLLLGANATLDAINAALAEIIRNTAQENDLVLFYFAGHSKPVRFDEDGESEVFLASYDFDADRIRRDTYFREEIALGMERLRSSFFERGRSRQRLFIFDSCYSGDFFGSPYRDATTIQDHIETVLSTKSPGRLALSSCLPYQKALEHARYGHGLFTYYLLQALTGEDRTALHDDGSLTVNGLFVYIAKKLESEGGQRPVLSGVQHGNFELLRYPHLAVPPTTESDNQSELQQMRQDEKTRKLHALLANHQGFIRDRLSSFVGRQRELAEIQHLIETRLPTGGYVTITGQAGQGKSSIIAKLVENYGEEQIAYHFIPFNPGPDHQVGLLRNLLARLILKYDLSDLYVASESRPVLRDYFLKVLEEIAAQGKQEILFLDGLDQLKADLDGERDLSFLPHTPPAGIVFVLSTRPNDTLRPLTRARLHTEYTLPDLSRKDFDLLLQHREVHLESRVADQFYLAMQANALYLDLAAKGLKDNVSMTAQDVMQRVADNPENLFSLAMNTLKYPPSEWREVIKPILGILLVAREPLGVRSIRQILHVEDERIREGVTRLGGLLSEDGKHQYSLFHLKLYDYLRQDEHHPSKEYIFASDEEDGWHQRLAQWCEQEHLGIIWQNEKYDVTEQLRRMYARQHYIEHLYYAKDWKKLFSTLDAGDYGRWKVRYDPSARLYVQDLDVGRMAAIWEGWNAEKKLELLPHLWRYTLLRCTLTSRADRYPEMAFRLLVFLKQKAKALGLAELLTNQARKAHVFLHIARQMLIQRENEAEYLELLSRVYDIAQCIEDSEEQANVCISLSNAYLHSGQLEHTRRALNAIRRGDMRDSALASLSTVLINMGQWDQAQEVIHLIENGEERMDALAVLGHALSAAQKWKQARAIWQQLEIDVRDALAQREDQAERTDALVELGQALIEAHQLEQAQDVINAIENAEKRMETLIVLGKALEDARHGERAQGIWQQIDIFVQSVIVEIQDNEERDDLLVTLSEAMIEAHQWDQARQVINCIGSDEKQTDMLADLGKALGEAQHWELAQGIWQHLIVFGRAMIARIEEKEERDKAFVSLNQTLCEARQWDQAYDVICSIENYTDRDEACAEFAQALIEDRQWDRARRVITSIGNYKERMDVVSTLKTALMDAQEWQQVQEIINLIENYKERIEALTQLGEVLIEYQHWEQAQSVMSAIDSPKEHVEGLAVLASALEKAFQWERAEAIWRQLERFVHNVMVEIHNNDEQDALLVVLNEALVKAHRWDLARDVIGCIQTEDERAEALIQLGKALIEARRWDLAQDIWQQLDVFVQNVVADIQDTDERDEVQAGWGNVLSQTRHWEQAHTVIRSIQNPREQMEAFIVLAQALWEAKRWEEAKELWQQLEMDVQIKVAEKEEQAECFALLSQSLIAAQHWGQAYRVTCLIEHGPRQDEALVALGEALIATQHWEQAQEVIDAIVADAVRARSLNMLCKALAGLQRWEQAQEIWNKVEEVITNLDRYAQNDLLRVWEQMLQDQQYEAESRDMVEHQSAEARRKLPGSAGRISDRIHVRRRVSRMRYQLRLRRRWAPSDLDMLFASSRSTLTTSQRYGRSAYGYSDDDEYRPFPRRLPRKKEYHTPSGRSGVPVRQISNVPIVSWQHSGKNASHTPAHRRRIPSLYKKAAGESGESALYEDTYYEGGYEEWNTQRQALGIEDLWLQARVLSQLGMVLSPCEQEERLQAIWERIESVIHGVKHPDMKAQATGFLALSLARVHQWERAKKMALSIADEPWQTAILFECVQFLTQSQQWEEAEQMLGNIHNTYWKTVALSNVGVSLMNHGLSAYARSIWSKIDEVLENNDKDENKQENAWGISRNVQNRRVLTDDETGIRRSDLIESWKQWEKYLILSERWDQAASIWTQNAGIIMDSRDEWQKEEALKHFGRALLEAGQWEQAEKVIATIINHADRTGAFIQLAKKLAKSNEYDRLVAFVQRTWKNAETREYVIQLLPIAFDLIPLNVHIGFAFYNAFAWVDTFLKGNY